MNVLLLGIPQNGVIYAWDSNTIYHVFYMCIVWCTVELTTKKGTKEYTTSSKTLQTEDGNPVAESDLTFGNTVIWLSKGIPYETTILGLHSKLTYASFMHLCMHGYSRK